MKKKTTYDPLTTARQQALQGIELAPFIPRAAAFLVDMVIAGVLFVSGKGLVESVLLKRRGTPESSLTFSLHGEWTDTLWLIVYFGLSFYLGKGQTIGKRLFRIRVISLTHERISLWHSVERALGYVASTLEGGFGFVQFFIHPNRQTVHDRIAETIVARDARPKKHPTTPKAQADTGRA
jgi:uncharacterized RDD family membrane protein YckC